MQKFTGFWVHLTKNSFQLHPHSFQKPKMTRWDMAICLIVKRPVCFSREKNAMGYSFYFSICCKQKINDASLKHYSITVLERDVLRTLSTF